ncbi:hypothetical protein ACFYT3_15025 [Nocardia amikacinitolerans]|uniref:Uncharacterized protein n=1 Tax=Nocardia amikacinitolerans TaxID=756689 RepID=A0A285LCM8_9NOCA|nr:hypothetical protein [Nocardia amikacinitolerans]MCP2278528.1 hypothetical protein [Nocardia amikacinitolerans]MCP2297410.1 hypothetical protein [Nocardia amikacinitolerans]MCP2318786.1 hypothetical protein [Nocardia amikacinitolerans]SNY82735.1 hypothetical protein SAMN04244553_3462 [Nocardia amikacinitolerans]
MTETSGANYHLNVGGDVPGQIAVGHHNTVSRVEAGRDSTQNAGVDLTGLRAEFERLRAQLPTDGPLRDQAAERVDELEEAVTADEPDLSTMEYVRNWFARRLPELAGAVTGLIVHPAVGALVAAAGAGLAGEFVRRFGSADGA